MTPLKIIGALIVTAIIVVIVEGFKSSDVGLEPIIVKPWPLMHRPRQESYDQENLLDLAGQRAFRCEAVYDAPEGNLRFCL